MAFELEYPVPVKVLDVRVLTSKDRKSDEPPGAQLLLQATLPSDILSTVDPTLAGTLYRKAGSARQGSLEGIEGVELSNIGEHVKRLAWDYKQTGCELEIDYGTGGKSNIVLTDCTVHHLLISPRQGGSVIVQWTIDSPGLTDGTRGKLTGLKSTESQMLLTAPKVSDPQSSLIEDTPGPGNRRGKKRQAEGEPA